jgi:hypothetical protein
MFFILRKVKEVLFYIPLPVILFLAGVYIVYFYFLINGF